MREYMRKNRLENPEKWQARVEARNAVKNGELKRDDCMVCGSPKSEAHHEDYSKPLNVIWLCHKHHMGYESGHVKLPT